MGEDTSTSHTNPASPRDEEQRIATLSINSSSIPRSFPQALPRNLNPSTPRAFEDVPRWQNSFDNLIPRTFPTTIDLLPAEEEEADPRTVPRSVLHCASISPSDEEHYTLSTSPRTHSSYVERLRQDIDPRTGSSYQFSSSRPNYIVNPREDSVSVYLSSSDKQQHGRTDSSFMTSYRERPREAVDNGQCSTPQLESEFLNNLDKELEVPCESRPAIGRSGQANLPRPRHPGADIVSQHKEYHQASASRRSANKIQDHASTPILLERARDAADSLDASSCGNRDQQSLDSDHSQLLSMSDCPPDSRRNSPSVLKSIEDTDQDSLGSPEDLASQFVVDCPVMRRPQSADIVYSRPTMRNMPQDELVGPPQVSAELVQIQMESGSFNSGNEHSTEGCSASQSTLPEMELQMNELEDALSSVSTSNMSSAEVTEATDSENPSSEDEHGQMKFPTGRLKRYLTARLVAGWLCDSIVVEFHNLANNFRGCPQGSDTGQAGRIANKRSLMDSPRQSNNNSSGAETGDGSDQERDDQSRRPRRKIQKVHDSSTTSPRLLACPFHKMYPIRYSGLNEWEKEYRKCSSGYWPDISRLK